jgi:hypothetical protein
MNKMPAHASNTISSTLCVANDRLAQTPTVCQKWDEKIYV